MLLTCFVRILRRIDMKNNNLLIVGAGSYGAVAEEIAETMGCFEKIAFVDDFRTVSANGKSVIGTTKQLQALSEQFGNVVVAVGLSKKREELFEEIREKTSCEIVSLISPRAYVSPNAQVGKGCIIEPMAVIHTNCVISDGCIISAGAVVNHFCKCLEYVHLDCNSTVEGESVVPFGVKICGGEVYNSKK